ncbi:MAG: BREX system ATP-binding domain-containing protein [Halofilum sp. (in: g-proteobacteria)]|nr:BREX system ATP-binding domain-containing protein [Halofilum sp. (in: g-proteobacteria)]
MAGGDESQYLVPDEALQAFMDHCHQRIGAAYFMTPRNSIKEFVNLLSVLEQNPDLDWRELIGDVQIQPEEAEEIEAMSDDDTDGGSSAAQGTSDDLGRRITDLPAVGSLAYERRTEPSEAFEALHPHIQRWIWRQGWQALRTDAGARAYPALIEGDRDVIVAAATAGGKTEAAFLPILSCLLGENTNQYECEGLALYIAPLKALINDQCQRMELTVEGTEIPVVPWHGDVARKQKNRFLKHTRRRAADHTGIAGGTVCQAWPPYALALRASRSTSSSTNLHAFIGVERGMQLESLMHRLELAVRRRVPRVGLSATLGDMNLAAEFLRPGGGDEVETIDLHGRLRDRFEATGPRLPPRATRSLAG